MLSQQDERIEEVSGTYFNLSTAVCFCQSRFYRKKGHVASQCAHLVRESGSFLRKRQTKTILTDIVAEHAKSRMSNARSRPRQVHV